MFRAFEHAERRRDDRIGMRAGRGNASSGERRDVQLVVSAQDEHTCPDVCAADTGDARERCLHATPAHGSS